AFIAVILWLLAHPGDRHLQLTTYERAISPLLTLFSVLALWSFAVLVHAVRREYRRSTDYPAPRDPTCDECGYLLISADPAGRCPECGRPIAQSVGQGIRPPTAW